MSTAGVDVHRLAGANEAQTKAMLDALVAANTPWPGAPPASPRSPSENGPPIDMPTGPDEWTVPDSFEPNEATIALAQEEAPKQRFFVESFGATRPVTLAREVNDNAGKTSDVSVIGGLEGRNEQARLLHRKHNRPRPAARRSATSSRRLF